MAAGICKQIQAGCDLYRSAKTQFVEIKATADQVMEIGKEVQGFWKKLLQFFSSKPTPSQRQQQAKPAAKKKEKFVAADEEQILNSVVDQLIQFFHIQQQLADHIREEEEKSRTVYDPTQNHFEAAIKRVRAQDQMNKLVEDIRMAMTWNAPQELGALYSKVMDMHEIVGAEQEAARLAQEAKAKRERWQRQQREASQRLKAGLSVLTFILILYLWTWFVWLSQARILQ
jgi:hypothetical protein